jgi:hypothetical protein
MKYRCAHCGKVADKAAGHINRARKADLNLYCDRRCSGLARRKGKTKAQKREEKRLYDIEYQAKNRERRLAQKKEYHKRTYDPVEAAKVRKKRAPYHVEYCRQPAYRAWKREYDRRYRATEFGEFAEAYMLTIDLNREIKGRITNAQVKYENGCTNKSQRREREAGQGPSRNRHSTSNG